MIPDSLLGDHAATEFETEVVPVLGERFVVKLRGPGVEMTTVPVYQWEVQAKLNNYQMFIAFWTTKCTLTRSGWQLKEGAWASGEP